MDTQKKHSQHVITYEIHPPAHIPGKQNNFYFSTWYKQIKTSSTIVWLNKKVVILNLTAVVSFIQPPMCHSVKCAACSLFRLETGNRTKTAISYPDICTEKLSSSLICTMWCADSSVKITVTSIVLAPTSGVAQQRNVGMKHRSFLLVFH